MPSTPSSALRPFVLLVSTAAFGVLVALAVFDGPELLERPTPALALFAACVVLGELLPIRLPGRSEDSVTISTTFTLALMLAFGTLPALVVQLMASALADSVGRKPARLVVFNVAQYALALGAAGLVLDALMVEPRLAAAPWFRPRDILAILAAALAFFVVNHVLAGTVQALAGGTAIRHHLSRDLGFHALTSATLVALVPFVLVAAAFSLWLIPLLGLPLMAIWRGGRQAVMTEYEALHDTLTGLPNRALFHDRASQTMLAHAREGAPGAVLLLDLDRFKEINDTLGHHYGDVLLQAVGPRLQATLRHTDTVARLGGDEFAVLMPGVSGGAVERVAQKIVDALERPYTVDGMTLDVGVSIGFARYPEDGEDVTTLLKRADIAMYLAKDARIGYAAYDAGRDLYSPSRLAMSGELRHAIEEGELVVHYQPKADLLSRRVPGVEALVRWQHPSHGLVPPDEFIPLAERTGLIQPLTMFVLDTALGQCRQWRDTGFELTVAVNLSARSLLGTELPGAVAALLAKWGLEPSALELEITEGAVMADPVRAGAVLEQLSAMGIELSLDDYGTGYSSLAYLRRLPVSELKIDKSLVVGMSKSEGDAMIVRSTIELSRSLGLRTVAEGVEGEEVWQKLAGLGCDEAQGYHLSRPLPAPELTAWLLKRAESAEPAVAGAALPGAGGAERRPAPPPVP